MHVPRVRAGGCLGRWKLCQALRRCRLDGRRDHPPLHIGEPHRMQGHEITASGEDLRVLGERVARETGQGLSLLLMDH